MGLITLPTIWVARQLVPAALLNGDFNAILNQVNGNIDATNLADLAVTTPKIAVGAVTGPKIAMGSDARGDILFRGAANYQRLAAGTAGQALISGGAGADPSWGDTQLVQVVNAYTGELVTCNTAVPLDDTIMSNTEGDLILTKAITPKNALNNFLITVTCACAMNATSDAVAIGLFHTIGGVAQAASICMGVHKVDGDGNNNGIKSITFQHFMAAGEAVAKTFTVRVGANSGATYVNGRSGARIYGGVLISSLTIQEIKA